MDDLIITQNVKHILNRYFPENWRLGVILYPSKSQYLHSYPVAAAPSRCNYITHLKLLCVCSLEINIFSLYTCFLVHTGTWQHIKSYVCNDPFVSIKGCTTPLLLKRWERNAPLGYMHFTLDMMKSLMGTIFFQATLQLLHQCTGTFYITTF
jgi:hypothetical protein